MSDRTVVGRLRPSRNYSEIEKYNKAHQVIMEELINMFNAYVRVTGKRCILATCKKELDALGYTDVRIHVDGSGQISIYPVTSQGGYTCS